MATNVLNKISEDELLDLAKKIGPSYYPSLGNKLGFGQAELDNFLILSQQDVQKAIQTILKRWNANRPMSENSRKVLGGILDDVELKAIGDLVRSGKVTDQKGAAAPSVNLNKGHPISCAVFVFSAIHDIKGDFAGLNHVVDFLRLHQGSYPIAIVTHVDVAQQKDIDILSAVLRVSGIGDIHEVANITNEKTKLEEQYQLNLLNFERCMTIGNDTVVYKHYQQVEMKKKAEGKETERKEAKTAKMNHTETVAIQAKEPSPEVLKVYPEKQMQEMEGKIMLDRLRHDLEMRKMQLDFQEKGLRMQMDFERQQFELQCARQNLELRQKQEQEAQNHYFGAIGQKSCRQCSCSPTEETKLF